MSEIIEKIRARGYWDLAIRPESFGTRLEYEDLDRVLEKAVVRFRGWPLPYIDDRRETRRAVDWIGQDIDASMVSHYEAWRFFTSGLFTQLRSISADVREGERAPQIPEDCESVIEVWEILFYLTEAFELAARLALSPAGDDRMHVDATLNDLNGRCLVVGDHRRAPFVEPYRANLPSLSLSVVLDRAELIADPRGPALTMAREFFLRFGWQPAVEALADNQRDLTDRRI